MKKILNKYNSLFFLIFLFLFVLNLNSMSWGKLKKIQTGNKFSDIEKPVWLKPPHFQYTPKNKVDPFKPFFLIPNQKNSQANDKSRGKAGPLQKIEPSQLNLVGILWKDKDPKKRIALVELPNGKGYVLNLGMPIGNRQGKVVKICKTKVIIQEKMITMLGNAQKHNVILKLHKNGEREK